MRQNHTMNTLRTLCLTVLLLVFTSQSVCAETGGAEDWIDLSVKGLRIGVGNGTVQEQLVRESYPDAELYYFDKVDGCTAVAQGKIDCYLYDKKQLELAVAHGQTGVRVLPQTVGESVSIALGLSETSQIPELPKRVNAFIEAIRADGTLDDMYDRWVVRGETTMPELPLPQTPAYHLKVGTSGIVEPYSYFVGQELTGYDIELSYRLAAWLDADVTFDIYDYGSIIAAANTGRVDVIAANLQVTPERDEAMLYSEPLYQEQTGIAVRDTGAVRWQDYNGKRIGVLVGPLMEDAAREFFPDSEYFLYNSYPDCCAALLAGKIDAFLGDEPGMKSIHAEQPEIDYIHDRLTENNYSFAFRKDDPQSAALCAELNDFLARCWTDGTMRELDEIWFGVDESRKVVDMSDLTGENGTIRVVTTATDMPWSYIKDGQNVGYDVDLVVRFCRDRGYALELGDVDFAGRIPALQSGRYDFTTDMNVTPEREEQVLFSDPTSQGGIVLAVLASAAEEESREESFLDGVRGSFERTFVREGRWKLFVEGVGTTMLITVLSILFGTALGFGVYMLCRNGNPVANAITRFCVWLVQGMPMVVLLMILFYIVFAKSTLSGTFIAVVGFTLVFGSAMYAMLCAGVGAIPKGQTEAAYALGYGDLQAFFRVILPQAVPHFLPAYKGEIVALIKATAIVGYISVQDLTKMGDIVRGRTYEPFFPLLAVAAIYFILAAVLTALVNRFEFAINPKRRRKEDILKGVETDD